LPLFSVIIPAYNRADLIRATLDSVLAQDLDDYEAVVADDGSKDDTVAVVSDYVSKHPGKVKLQVQENRGEGAARNLAIRHATGDYLAYLDSDDTFFPWTLSTFARAIRENNRPASIGGMCYPFHDESELALAKQEEYRAEYYPDMFAYLRACADTLTTSGSIMRRDVVEKTGLFQEQHINGVDLDLWLRIGVEPGFVRLRAPVLAGRRAHPSNVSGNKDMMIRGANNLIAREKAGVYPGGKSRQRERLEFLTFNVRWMMMQALLAGRQRAGWEIYRACFPWHVRLGRMRCLFGFPALSLKQLIKPRGGR